LRYNERIRIQKKWIKNKKMKEMYFKIILKWICLFLNKKYRKHIPFIFTIFIYLGKVMKCYERLSKELWWLTMRGHVNHFIRQTAFQQRKGPSNQLYITIKEIVQSMLKWKLHFNTSLHSMWPYYDSEKHPYRCHIP
jgi:hypothetical protein